MKAFCRTDPHAHVGRLPYQTRAHSRHPFLLLSGNRPCSQCRKTCQGHPSRWQGGVEAEENIVIVSIFDLKSMHSSLTDAQPALPS